MDKEFCVGKTPYLEYMCVFNTASFYYARVFTGGRNGDNEGILKY
jgi:hypothetical protein